MYLYLLASSLFDTTFKKFLALEPEPQGVRVVGISRDIDTKPEEEVAHDPKTSNFKSANNTESEHNFNSHGISNETIKFWN